MLLFCQVNSLQNKCDYPDFIRVFNKSLLEFIHASKTQDFTSLQSLEYGYKFWQPLKNFRHCPPLRYESIAYFFYLLGEYKISAYCYQISNGKIPKKIFKLAFPQYTKIIYYLSDEKSDMELCRETSFLEKTILLTYSLIILTIRGIWHPKFGLIFFSTLIFIISFMMWGTEAEWPLNLKGEYSRDSENVIKGGNNRIVDTPNQETFTREGHEENTDEQNTLKGLQIDTVFRYARNHTYNDYTPNVEFSKYKDAV